jgi:inosose dehydratase
MTAVGATFRLANAPVSWGVTEVRAWSPATPYTRVLDEIAASGYRATELGPYGYYPTDPAKLRDELARRNLELTSAFVPLRLRDAAAVRASLDETCAIARLLAACGAKYLVLADAMWPERMACAGWADQGGIALTTPEWKTVAQSARTVADLAAVYGLRCVFHHHVGTYVESPDEVARLMQETDLALCLDTGHYFYGGGDPVQAVREYGPRIEYLHLKDVNPRVLGEARRERLGFLDGIRRGVFCELGRGGVDFPALKQELDDVAFNGWAVVEQDVEQDVDPSLDAAHTSLPERSAEASLDFLRHLGF